MYDCIRCLAETDNDCDICDDCLAEAKDNKALMGAADEIERLRGELAQIRKLDAKAFANWRKTRETLHAEIERLRATEQYTLKTLELANQNCHALNREIERLRATLAHQASAVRTLQNCEDTEINRLRKTHRMAKVAESTLESERAANALLTEEIDRLRSALALIEKSAVHGMGHYKGAVAQKIVREVLLIVRNTLSKEGKQ